MGPTWGPPGADRSNVGLMSLAIDSKTLVTCLNWLQQTSDKQCPIYVGPRARITAHQIICNLDKWWKHNQCHPPTIWLTYHQHIKSQLTNQPFIQLRTIELQPDEIWSVSMWPIFVWLICKMQLMIMVVGFNKCICITSPGLLLNIHGHQYPFWMVKKLFFNCWIGKLLTSPWDSDPQPHNLMLSAGTIMLHLPNHLSSHNLEYWLWWYKYFVLRVNAGYATHFCMR